MPAAVSADAVPHRRSRVGQDLPARRRRPTHRSVSGRARCLYNCAVSENETSWGIDPVPERLRVLGGFDLALLWGNLGVSLLVVVAGAILVPALSLPSAFVAIVVGCLIGNLMLAVAGLIGAQARVPGDDADAGAARRARVVPADRDQHRPVPRLDRVRAARDRDRRSSTVRPAARRRGAVGVDARLRRGGARDGPRSARSASCARCSARSRSGSCRLRSPT